jgi:DNA recombination protein RmuC
MLQQQVTTAAAQQETRLGEITKRLDDSLQRLNTQLNERLTQNQQLAQQTQKSIAERLEAAGKTMGDLRGQLGELGQATKNILQVGSEVRKLQDILQSPKLRGGLGEWTLENLLAEVLPRQHYHLQYRFRNGNQVDALVELAQGRVCIDAKFPLPNFQAMSQETDKSKRQKLRKVFLRDVIKHIDTIAAKYIVPEEGTLDFALMYVPAENVYYEMLQSDDKTAPDISNYGRDHKVVPVSPNTLYSYLMVIAAGLKGLKIEENAQMIRQQLTQLAGELDIIVTDVALTGKHLTNAKTKFDEADKKLSQFSLRLKQIEKTDDESASNS